MLVEAVEQGPNTISILLTTDNHVGYAENDPVRGDDAWITFDEVMKLGKERDVDMVVQGGDLFHINKPTKKSLFHVMKSLRENCMGERPCELQMLSDPNVGLSNGLGGVNYEDPNLNILMPVFAISGNHDDSTGDGFLSPLDILAMSGLVNHFGKVKDNENITVSPLLFQKGSSKLALYGLANVRDERLHRSFRDGLVKFQRPTQDQDDWFNMFVIHQNHAQHTVTSCIPENFLPNFLNFILWGHEHECVPFPVHNPETGFDVLIGGSSVATSLSEGETADKCAYILNIQGSNYSVEAIKLKSVRPFVLKEVALLSTSLIPDAVSKNDVVSYLIDEVETLITLANEKYNLANNVKEAPLPLVRLKVEYSGGYEIENARRFSNRFVGKIANVNDVVLFYKKRGESNAIKKTKFVDSDLFGEGLNNKKSVESQLQDIMAGFLAQAELALLPESGFNHAVQKFVENDDKHVLLQFIKREIKNEADMLMKIDIDDEEFHGDNERQTANAFKHVLAMVKKMDRSAEPTGSPEPEKAPKKRAVKAPRKKAVKSNDRVSESEEEDPKPRARARPGRATKAKAAKKLVDVDSEEENEDEERSLREEVMEF